MPNIKQLLNEKMKELFPHIKDIKETEDNKFKVIASTEDVDRDGEVIKLDGWNADNWFKNPVILSNHSYRVENIVGKGLKLYEEKGKLVLEGVFTDITEAGKICKELYEKGFLKAVSVGFRGSRNENDRTIIEKAELLEVSFVAVPANPNALSLDGKTYKKGIEIGIIKELKNEQEDKKTQVNIKDFNELKNQVSEIQETLKTIADGKAFAKGNDEEDGNSEKIVKEFLQNLGKNVSNSLFQLKKNESK